MSSLGQFLRSRRARLHPEQLGLAPGGGRRQTPGLRREELATLAGVSVDYYIRLEQGRDTRPSDAVLAALASALRLDGDERTYLQSLTRQPPLPAPPGRTPADTVRPGLLHLLESVRPTPAFVLNPTSTILAANQEGLLLLSGIEDWPPAGRNLIRYIFTHRAARSVFGDWEQMARDCVAHLRTLPPEDPRLAELATELSAASADFAQLWRHYDVRVKRGSRRTFHHPRAGRLVLTSEILTAADGQRFVTFQADPATRDHEALTLLAS